MSPSEPDIAKTTARGGNGSQQPRRPWTALDFRNFAEDADSFLRATANYSGEGAAAARARFEDQLNRLRREVDITEAGARDYLTRRYRQVTQTTNRYVHEKPWRLIWAAATVGLVVGLVAGRP